MVITSINNDAPSGTDAVDAVVIETGYVPEAALQTCRALRASGIDVPVLVVTARNTAEERIEAFDAGADACLSEPIVVDELLARLRALLRSHPP